MAGLPRGRACLSFYDNRMFYWIQEKIPILSGKLVKNIILLGGRRSYEKQLPDRSSQS